MVRRFVPFRRSVRCLYICPGPDGVAVHVGQVRACDITGYGILFSNRCMTLLGAYKLNVFCCLGCVWLGFITFAGWSGGQPS